MKHQLTLTGGRKIMNMRKVGTVSQVRKTLQLAENPMNTGNASIHYAHGSNIEADDQEPAARLFLLLFQVVMADSGTVA
jgi:hypothetical protein